MPPVDEISLKVRPSVDRKNSLISGLLDKLSKSFCCISPIGFSGKVARTNTLCVNDIYVDLKCVPYPNSDKNIDPLSCLMLVNGYPDSNIVILGLPGGGKSTLIKELLFNSICGVSENKIIPIYLELKNDFVDFFSEMKIEESIGLKIENYARKRFNNLTSKGDIGTRFFDEIDSNDDWEERRYLLFCDGLDEISTSDYQAFNTLVNDIAKKAPFVRFIISSRYAGFKSEHYSSDHFRQYSLLSFNKEQAKKYVQKFFQLFESTDAHRLNAILHKIDNGSFSEIISNPIMLTLMCIVDDLQTINDRASLFEKAIHTILIEHSRIEKAQNEAEMMTFLKTIAVCFYKQDKLENFERGELDFFAQKILTDKETKENYLRCGLFDGSIDINAAHDDKDCFKFYHRTIWEYLVAQGMIDRPEYELYERANMKGWSVPIRMWVLLFIKKNTEGKIKEMFHELWRRNKALTLECLCEYEKSKEILQELYTGMDKRQKLRLIAILRDTYIDAPDYKVQAVDMVVKALTLIHENESQYGKDCEVIYEYLSFLEEFSNEQMFSDLYDEILDFRDNHLEKRLNLLASKGLHFLEIKAGKYEMGRDKFAIPVNEDSKRFVSIDEEETPKHKVKLTQDFYMSQTLITNEMYFLCGFPFASDKHGFNERDNRFNNSYSPLKGDPVNYITWYEAMVFAKWLKCTLPSEAEWEYACRGYGKDTTNDDELCIVQEQNKLRSYLEQKNEKGLMRAHYSHSGNTTLPRSIYQVNDVYTISADDPRRNHLGLIDMLGNLREWCLDWFGEDYYKKCNVGFYKTFHEDIADKETITYYFDNNDVPHVWNGKENIQCDLFTFDREGYCVDPIKKTVEITESKCLRGGCFDWNVTNLRPTYRNHNPATNVYKVNGFRIIKKM